MSIATYREQQAAARAKVLALAQQITEHHLPTFALRAGEDGSHRLVVLEGSGKDTGLTLPVELSGGRVRVIGCSPQTTLYSAVRPVATVAASRGARTIAAEITRRVLGPLRADLGRVLAHNAAELVRREACRELTRELARILHTAAPSSVEHVREERHRFSVPGVLGSVEVHGDAMVNVELSYIPPAQARAVLRALTTATEDGPAEDDDQQAPPLAS